MILPQTQDKRVRLDHGSTTTYPYVALLPVQSRQLGDQLGRVKTHADRDGLKLVHFLITIPYNSQLFQNIRRKKFKEPYQHNTT